MFGSPSFRKQKTSLKEGRWKEFNKHAILISVGNYLHGKKNGPWKEYYDTGELMLEENYVYGVVHGRFATYHPSGQLLSEGTYHFGNREGSFRVFDEIGTHIKTLRFRKDKLIEEVEINDGHVPSTCQVPPSENQ